MSGRTSRRHLWAGGRLPYPARDRRACIHDLPVAQRCSSGIRDAVAGNAPSCGGPVAQSGLWDRSPGRYRACAFCLASRRRHSNHVTRLQRDAYANTMVRRLLQAEWCPFGCRTRRDGWREIHASAGARRRVVINPRLAAFLLTRLGGRLSEVCVVSEQEDTEHGGAEVRSGDAIRDGERWFARAECAPTWWHFHFECVGDPLVAARKAYALQAVDARRRIVASQVGRARAAQPARRPHPPYSSRIAGMGRGGWRGGVDGPETIRPKLHSAWSSRHMGDRALASGGGWQDTHFGLQGGLERPVETRADGNGGAWVSTAAAGEGTLQGGAGSVLGAGTRSTTHEQGLSRHAPHHAISNCSQAGGAAATSPGERVCCEPWGFGWLRKTSLACCRAGASSRDRGGSGREWTGGMAHAAGVACVATRTRAGAWKKRKEHSTWCGSGLPA